MSLKLHVVLNNDITLMSNSLYLHEQTRRLHTATLDIHKNRADRVFPFPLFSLVICSLVELVFIDMK